jgi:hypothetical protein
VNPFTYKVACSVCGEEGYAHARHRGADWYAGSSFTHTDPRVCQDNLAAERRRREAEAAKNAARIKELEEQVAQLKSHPTIP